MRVPADAPLLSSAAMRAAEAAAVAQGTSLATLMERAGGAVAELAWRMAAGRSILILAGPGNNGGDGYVAARRLRERGAAVRVAAWGEPGTDLARAARAGWDGPVEPLNDRAAPAPVMVDALFGIGLNRALDAELAAVLSRLRKARGRVLAVDVPSGVGGNGEIAGAVPLPADVTLALGALKPAHVLLPAAAQCGEVRLADIGLDERTDARWRTVADAATVAAPSPAAHKYARGLVLVRGGAMAGAAALSALAAARGGAGYVVLCSDGAAPAHAIVRAGAGEWARWIADPRLGAVVAGPGWVGSDADTMSVLEQLLRSDVPLVLDAGAAVAAAPLLASTPRRAPTILTPHEGEFARAFPGVAGGNKIERSLAAAMMTGAIVVHKGADTIIAAADGRLRAGWPGCGWLATAGSGDVLAGLCAAALSGGGDAFDAASDAVVRHVAAARRAGAGMIADDLVEQLR